MIILDSQSPKARPAPINKKCHGRNSSNLIMPPLNVFPHFIFNNPMNRRNRNSEFFSKKSMIKNSTVSNVPGFYLSYLILFQFRCAYIFSPNIATLVKHIFDVVVTVSKKQMLRINTNSVIAFMENPKIIRYFSIMYSPRKTMSLFFRPFSIFVNSNASISSFPGFKFPTSRSFFNFPPETFFSVYSFNCHCYSVSVPQVL